MRLIIRIWLNYNMVWGDNLMIIFVGEAVKIQIDYWGWDLLGLMGEIC